MVLSVALKPGPETTLSQLPGMGKRKLTNGNGPRNSLNGWKVPVGVLRTLKYVYLRGGAEVYDGSLQDKGVAMSRRC